MKPPDGTLVANGWLRLAAGLPASCIGPTLPAARQEPAPAWVNAGFIQHTVVGGSPAVHIPQRETVVQLDFWAVTLDDRTPPWGIASALAETVWQKTYNEAFTQGLLEPPAGYAPARLQTVTALTEPRKINGDPAGFAHFMMDVRFAWTPSTLE